MPTFAEFIPQVVPTVTAGTLKAYGTYWKRILEHWGSRRLDEPSPLEIERFGKELRAARVQRRNGRGGNGTEENFLAAIRCLYKRAVANGHIAPADNPAARGGQASPTAKSSARAAGRQAREDQSGPATSGDDPELDSLILRIHEETACPRMGALNLRPMDLDEDQRLVRLREKAGTERWQTVSPTLMSHLNKHAAERNAPLDGQLLRYRNGRPITYRCYDHLWVRLGEALPWIVVQGISTLDPPHHPQVGGTLVRLRRGPRLRETQRTQRRRGKHRHLRQSPGRRSRRRTRHAHGEPPPLATPQD